MYMVNLYFHTLLHALDSFKLSSFLSRKATALETLRVETHHCLQVENICMYILQIL